MAELGISKQVLCLGVLPLASFEIKAGKNVENRRARDVAQLVECLPSTQRTEAMVWSLHNIKPNVVSDCCMFSLKE